MMFPLYSILKASDLKPPDVNVVLLHLKRRHLMEWVRAVMATTLGVQRGGALPPILLQEETDTATEQPGMALEGVPSDTWVRNVRQCVDAGCCGLRCPALPHVWSGNVSGVPCIAGLHAENASRAPTAASACTLLCVLCADSRVLRVYFADSAK